ncbi:radical SAM protein [Myxococcota bacterium]|nr:radical SAM protein [Myxococcota bacterium]
MNVYEHLARWRGGERPGPLRLHLVLTERCNLRCLSCFMGQTPTREREREVPDAVLLRLVEDGIRMGVREIYLVGGEVFVRRDVTLALMERIKAAGLFGDLTTNGTLIDDDAARRIVEMGWDRLQVSIDGPTAALNDAIRPPAGSFDRVMASLGRLAAWKERAGSPLPAVTVSTVVSNRNSRHLPDLVRLAAGIGAVGIAFQSLKDGMSEQAPGMMLSPGERGELQPRVLEAMALADAHHLDTNLGDFLETPIVENIGRLDRVMRGDVHDVEDPFFRAHCFVPWYYVVVHFDGRVSPCWEWTGEGMGDARTATLEEIWHGPLFERFRREFGRKQVPDHCAQCCLGYLDHTRWLREMGLLAAGNHREALKVAERLLATRPHHAPSAEVKARCLYHLGRGAEARAWLLEVAGTWPPDALAHLTHLLDVPALFRDRTALSGLATRLLERLGPERLAGQGGRLLPDLALALAEAGRCGEALELLGRGETAGQGREPKAVRARIAALYGGGRRDEARAWLREAIGDADQGSPESRAELLFHAHRARDEEAVVEGADALLAADPDLPYAHWIRAAALGKLGRIRDARRGCEAALRALATRPGPFEDAVHDTLAELALKEGDAESALAHAQRALALDPHRPGTLRLLRQAQARLDRRRTRRGGERGDRPDPPRGR